MRPARGLGAGGVVAGGMVSAEGRGRVSEDALEARANSTA